MCSLKIQKTILNICNRAQRHCLWAKGEDSSSVNALVAWSHVCRPKKHGGLWVLNLELQNKAPLMKQLHKFYSKAYVPWVHLVWSLYGEEGTNAKPKRGSFWWKDICSLIDEYRSISHCNIGDGSTVLFWKDFWLNGELLCDKYPRLFSYALNEDISVSSFASMHDAGSSFSLPLSVEAYHEYQEVSVLMNATTLDNELMDTRSFVWGDKYTHSKYYNFLFTQVPQDAALNAIWASKALPKLKVFLWTLMIDRLNKRDIMLRKTGILTMVQNVACAMLRYWKLVTISSSAVNLPLLARTRLAFIGQHLIISLQISSQPEIHSRGRVLWKLWLLLVGTFGKSRMNLFFMEGPAH
jgi:hypothetical protein